MGVGEDVVPAYTSSDERAELVYEVREHRRKIVNLEQAVFMGNGHKPLLERTTTLETEVAMIKKSIESLVKDTEALRRGQSMIVWKILGGTTVLLGIFFTAILTYVLGK